MILDFITDEYTSVCEECNESPKLWDVLYKLYRQDINAYLNTEKITFEDIKKMSRKEFDIFFNDAFSMSTDEGEVLSHILNYAEDDFLVYYNPVYDIDGTFIKVEKLRLAYTTFTSNEVIDLIVKYLKYHNISSEEFFIKFTQHLLQE